MESQVKAMSTCRIENLSLDDCICPPLQEPLLLSSMWIIFRDTKGQLVISLKDWMSPGAPTGQSKVELRRSFSVA